MLFKEAGDIEVAGLIEGQTLGRTQRRDHRGRFVFNDRHPEERAAGLGENRDSAVLNVRDIEVASLVKGQTHGSTQTREYRGQDVPRDLAPRRECRCVREKPRPCC